MEDRYLLQKSETQPNGWVLVDTQSQLVCRFVEHEFNDTQSFTFLDDDAVKRHSPIEMAQLVNEMAVWGATFHYNILMPEVYISARHQIGREIAYYRQQRGMTQRELAEASGVNYANIAKLETGKYNASVDIVDKVASVLGVRLGVRLGLR